MHQQPDMQQDESSRLVASDGGDEAEDRVAADFSAADASRVLRRTGSS